MRNEFENIYNLKQKYIIEVRNGFENIYMINIM